MSLMIVGNTHRLNNGETILIVAENYEEGIFSAEINKHPYELIYYDPTGRRVTKSGQLLTCSPDWNIRDPDNDPGVSYEDALSIIKKL